MASACCHCSRSCGYQPCLATPLGGVLCWMHNLCSCDSYRNATSANLCSRLQVFKAAQSRALRMYMLCTGSGRRKPRARSSAATFSERHQDRNTGSRSCIAASQRQDAVDCKRHRIRRASFRVIAHAIYIRIKVGDYWFSLGKSGCKIMFQSSAYEMKRRCVHERQHKVHRRLEPCVQDCCQPSTQSTYGTSQTRAPNMPCPPCGVHEHA